MISKNKPELSFVCFGGVDWWYHHRGHADVQLVRQYVKNGPVLYINSIVMQKAGLGRPGSFIPKLIRKTKSITKGLEKIEQDFWVYSPFSLPLHHLAAGRILNEKILLAQIRNAVNKIGISTPIVWVVCPTACDVALKMPRSKLVYLRTDVYELFPGVHFETIRNFDLKLKACSDLTLFVSKNLFDEEAHMCKRALYLSHGVNYEMFSCLNDQTAAPADMARIPKPIVGYFGSICGPTVDYALLSELADLLPQMSFVFVGKVYDNIPFLDRKNVWILGQKPYEEVPCYGRLFDVTIMPWRQTDWIRACNPVKLKEYLALGKPIVSTPFPELEKYSDLVYIAKTPNEFAACIRKALAEDSSEHIATRRKKVEKATWDSKAQLVLNKLFGKDGDLQESA
jgi:glycosyltransferase involved in cell wall biosynthesis